jgi:hypothetical protein
MLSNDFFILNRATHFSFPHDRCDQIPTDRLIHEFFHPDYFCAHIVRHFDTQGKHHAILERLREHPVLDILGAAFMRMKFLAEVLDIRRLLPRVKGQKRKGGFLKGEVVAVWEWETHGTERYAAIDNLANQLCNAVIEIVRDTVRNTDSLTDYTALVNAAHTINEELPKIRREKYEQYVWDDIAPYMLVNYPYFVYVVKAWSVLEPIVVESLD